jgi:hypothetical protein
MKKTFFSILVLVLAACATQPVMPLPLTATITPTIVPILPTATITPTATLVFPKNPAGYGQVPGEVTPTSGVIISPSPEAVSTPEPPSGLESFIPPTAGDAVVDKGESSPIPDYAKVKYDSMVTIPMLRQVAVDCGVYQKDITVDYIQNRLGDPLATWTLVYTTPNGVCWSKVENKNQLAEYPTYWKPGTNEVMGALQPSTQNDGVGWQFIEGKMAWLGTRPGMLNGIGSIKKDGQAVDAYSSYIVPGGMYIEDLSNDDNWKLVDGVMPVPKPPQFFLDIGLSREDLKNFIVQEDGTVIDKRDGSVAYNVYHRLVSVKYGNWVLDANGKLVPGDVSLDNMSCIQEGTPCIKDDVDIYLDSATVHRVQALSTGAFERTIIHKPGAQEVWGIGDIAWMKTKNGVFPLLVTFEDKDKIGYNVLYKTMSVRVMGGISANFPKKMLSPIQVENALPPGFSIEIGSIQAENKTLKRFAQYEEGSRFLNRFNNEAYIEKVNTFFNSLKKGTPATLDLDYLLPITNTIWG